MSRPHNSGITREKLTHHRSAPNICLSTIQTEPKRGIGDGGREELQKKNGKENKVIILGGKKYSRAVIHDDDDEEAFHQSIER